EGFDQARIQVNVDPSKGAHFWVAGDVTDPKNRSHPWIKCGGLVAAWESAQAAAGWGE
ncbi:unnamed protein product, partial [Prorocentrum cordatum]